MSSLRAACVRLAAAAAWLLIPALLSAQLPAAADLMAAHNQAIGGEATVAAFPGVHLTATMPTPDGGAATIEGWAARPNRMVTVMLLPGMGEVRQGYDGETAWSIDPFQGARILQGDEAAQRKDEATVETILNLRNPASYRSAETVEKTSMGGQECWKVKLVKQSGRELFECYATADGLLVASMETSPTGGEVVSLLQEYKAFGPVKSPTRIVNQFAGGQDQTITITKLEAWTPEPARLELPAEIKALLKK